LNLWHIPTDRGRARNAKILAIFDGKVLATVDAKSLKNGGKTSNMFDFLPRMLGSNGDDCFLFN